ncbi:4Fe-4S dicluster domain-containing protein [Alicyclobacillaceae bacterium I2511]|jgi:ferredoxin like protein|nr:4Fe-4S dicluster domain-containing protein [Alicyclobacillaceae bacterium I2511]
MSVSIEERLYTIRYKADEQSHLAVQNPQVCTDCKLKECLSFCPADVYDWDVETQTLTIAYENCVECGTCRVACAEDNIEWKYPTGGYGISYKLG